MNPIHRLHALRMENDAAGYAMAEMRPRFERMANRHANGTAPRAVSAFNLFQTPPPLAAQLVSMLDLKPGARVLEPSAGLGRILDALQPFAPAEVVAVEMAPQCAGELFRQERAGVRILQRDFLTLTPAEAGLFDAVAMNPPFHMRADVRHILHARTFLKPGGRLAAICLDGHQRERALRPLAATWTHGVRRLWQGGHTREHNCSDHERFMRTNTTTEPILVVGSVNTLAAAIVHQDEGEPGSNRRFEHWKRTALHDYSDQRAVLDCKPLRGLRAVHECAGLYVIVRECPHAPDNYEVIAENLTAEHARQICEAVNSAAK